VIRAIVAVMVVVRAFVMVVHSFVVMVPHVTGRVIGAVAGNRYATAANRHNARNQSQVPLRFASASLPPRGRVFGRGLRPGAA
jgi:hypothetical protein